MVTARAGLAGGVRSGAAVMRCRSALKLLDFSGRPAVGEPPGTGDLREESHETVVSCLTFDCVK